MSTTKTILIVGGGLVGAFVLYKVLTPAAAAKPRGSASASGNQSSFIGLGASVGSLLGGLFSGGRQSSSTGQTGGSFASPSFGGQPGYIFSGGSSSTSGIDPNTGGVVLPEGASYGPALPSSSDSGFGSDDESFV